MSLAALERVIAPLPYALREQVFSYARAVRDAAPEILSEAKLPYSDILRDRLVFYAGVRKLHALSTSSFWTLDASTRLMEGMEVDQLSAGSTDFSRGSDFYNSLSRLTRELSSLLAEFGFTSELLRLPYAQVAQVLADGR